MQRGIPKTILEAESCIPYTTVNNTLTQETDRLGLNLSLALEDMGIANVMMFPPTTRSTHGMRKDATEWGCFRSAMPDISRAN